MGEGESTVVVSATTATTNDDATKIGDAYSSTHPVTDQYRCRETQTENDSGPASEASVRPRGIVYFRSVNPNDRTVVQRLHEKWFPVEYKSEFYDGLCRERIMPGTGEPLYCCVACYIEMDDADSEAACEELAARMLARGECDDYFVWEPECSDGDGDAKDRENACVGDSNGEIGSAEGTTSLEEDLETGDLRHRPQRDRMKRFYDNGFRFDSDEEEEEKKHCEATVTDQNDKTQTKKRRRGCDGPYLNDVGERVIGCLVGSFLPSSMLSARARGKKASTASIRRNTNKTKARPDDKSDRDETAALLVPDPDRHKRMFYIMTLGTTRDFRRSGLGSILVERVANMVQSLPEVGTLHLHVITYNRGAIRLYEKLGFMRVKEIEGYYSINGIHYNCYLYARYFHGNMGHRSIYDVLVGYAQSVWNYFAWKR